MGSKSIVILLSHSESQLNVLPDSAIGLWLQQQKLVKRVCHRITKEKVDAGKKYQIVFFIS